MIKFVEGDLLTAKEDILIHQVNCQGVMKSGIAREIREQYPKSYIDYKDFCKKYTPPIERLGKVAISDCKTKIIGHLFGQFDYGYDGALYTNYEALKESMILLLEWAKTENRSIAIPHNIGCNRAGGEWEIVFNLIKEVFQDYGITIYKYNKN